MNWAKWFRPAMTCTIYLEKTQCLQTLSIAVRWKSLMCVDVCMLCYVFYVIISPPTSVSFLSAGEGRKRVPLCEQREKIIAWVGLECWPCCFCPHNSVKYTLLSIRCLGGHTSPCAVDVLTCSSFQVFHCFQASKFMFYISVWAAVYWYL